MEMAVKPPWTLPNGWPIVHAKDVDAELLDDVIESGHVVRSECSTFHEPEKTGKMWHGTRHEWLNVVETQEGDEKVTQIGRVAMCDHGAGGKYYEGPFGDVRTSREPIDYKALAQTMSKALKGAALTPGLQQAYHENVSNPLTPKETGHERTSDNHDDRAATPLSLARIRSWLRHVTGFGATSTDKDAR